MLRSVEVGGVYVAAVGAFEAVEFLVGERVELLLGSWDADLLFGSAFQRDFAEDFGFELASYFGMGALFAGVGEEPVFLQEFGSCQSGVLIDVDEFFEDVDALIG